MNAWNNKFLMKLVFRSEKLERKCNKLNDRKRFEDIEELYSTLHEEVDKEFEMIKDVRKLNSLNHQNISEVEDAEDLCLLLEASHDAVSLEVCKGINFYLKSKNHID